MQRLLPPLLLILIWVAMIGATLVVPLAQLIPWPINLVGVPLALAGLAIAIIGAKKFKAVGTNIMTFDNPDILVTDGLFSHSRNPMYLGFALCAFGGAFAAGNVAALIIAIAFLVVLDRWYVQFEEAKMLQIFGVEYENYKKMVRRWI